MKDSEIPPDKANLIDRPDFGSRGANERMPLLLDVENLDLLRENPDRVKDMYPRQPNQSSRIPGLSSKFGNQKFAKFCKLAKTWRARFQLYPFWYSRE